MSSVEQISEEIREFEARIESQEAELDKCIKAFGTDMIPLVADWMDAEVRRLIEANPQRWNQAGVDEVRAVKAALSQLKERLPDICNEATGEAFQIPHNNLGTSLDARNRYPEECFKRAVRPLGELLEQFDLVPARGGQWERDSSRSFTHTGHTGIRAPEVMTRYASLNTDRDNSVSRLRRKQDDLEKAKVRLLWDQA